MSTDDAPPPAPWEVAHVLAEPTRRRLFDAVRRSRRAMTRDEVSRETGVNRRLTAFHLDRLAEAGLLLTDYARPAGRGGPGAGRPAKRYTASEVDLELTLPPRRYDLAASLLARAVSRQPTDAEAESMQLAYDEGRRVGELRRPGGRPGRGRGRAAALEALGDMGYEPGPEGGAATVRLRNCPFHSVADVAPDLVCGMNCELVGGLFDGLGLGRERVTLDPAPPSCCLTVALP